MYSFEGNFKTHPGQSLRGASKRLQKDQLIQKAVEDRKQRQELRKQIKAATIIQSCYRSYYARKNLFSKLRLNYDKNIGLINKSMTNNIEDLTILTRDILLFYNSDDDFQRLLSFGQIFMGLRSTIVYCLSLDFAQWLHRIKKLIFLNIRQLNKSLRLEQGSSIAVPLRLIEICTTESTFSQLNDLKITDKIICPIWFYLIRKEYFACIRKLIDTRIPEPYEVKMVLTPLADSVFDLILRPLSFDLILSPSLALEVTTKFFKEFLAGPLSPQIKLHFLPKLLNYTPPCLSPTAIVRAMMPVNLNGENDENINILSDFEPNIWLLNSILQFICYSSHKYEFQLFSDRFKYLLILHRLSKSIPEDEPKKMDTDDVEEMECDKFFNENEKIVAKENIQMINEPKHVNCLISLIDKPEFKSIALAPLSGLCYAMLHTNPFAVHKNRLLYTLTFNSYFLQILWAQIKSISTSSVFETPTLLLKLLSTGLFTKNVNWNSILPQLTLFCTLFSYLLPALDDAEFYGQVKNNSMPFTLDELQKMTSILKDVCIGLIQLAYHDTKLPVTSEYYNAMKSVRKEKNVSKIKEEIDVNSLQKVHKSVTNLLRQLYNRDLRKPYCPPNHWISKNVNVSVEKPTNFRVGIRQRERYRQFFGLRRLTREELEEHGPPLSVNEIRNITILQEIPFVVPFHDRVKILQTLMSKDKEMLVGDRHQFLVPGYTIDINIRRNFIYEDSFEKLSLENEPNLKKPIRVQLINAVGLEEAGIDGGGIFREFLSELLKTCFDPNRGFFRTTNDRLLCPNPASQWLIENYQKHYYFCGRILGKAIYQNMLVELPFAPFFLSKILAEHLNSDVDFHHLETLDPVMYKNLVYLKNYSGDVSELGLDFTVVNSEFGESQIVELKPGGSNIQVNAQNRIEYIHLMADYRLNKQIRPHCASFKQGLANVIDLEWIRMFGPHELQIIISGAQTPIDIADLKEHVYYSGGYHENHKTILAFWEVVENFNENERRQLLKFVTSCSHPPLLGFKDLDPPFCIQFAGREDRLPTASTCMNLLKLPEFDDADTLRKKLLYAIECGVGFELS